MTARDKLRLMLWGSLMVFCALVSVKMNALAEWFVRTNVAAQGME